MTWRWRSGRRARESAATIAERRLAAFAGQWRPAAPEPPSVLGAWTGSPEAPGRPALGPWSRSAVRALALLVAVTVAVTAYWLWSGRPRVVAQAPRVLATGIALLGATPGPSATAAPPSAPASPASPNTPSATAVAPPAVPDVVVHVTGLVARPGLVSLPPGSRVADAIDAAGGVTRRRAADSVNLARILVDGEQVVVSLAPATAAAAAPPVAAASSPAGTLIGGPVDLNRATQAALEGLPGVGPVIAARIIAWRTANGAFRSVDELGEVSGIGDSILAQIRPLVRV